MQTPCNSPSQTSDPRKKCATNGALFNIELWPFYRVKFLVAMIAVPIYKKTRWVLRKLRFNQASKLEMKDSVPTVRLWAFPIEARCLLPLPTSAARYLTRQCHFRIRRSRGSVLEFVWFRSVHISHDDPTLALSGHSGCTRS